MANNHLKTAVLLAVLTALLLWMGSFFGNGGLIVAAVLVLCMNGFSYFFSDKLVLFMFRAKPAAESDYPELYRMIREIAHLAFLPMPKVYLISTAHCNAFATGRNPRHAAVAVTQGIIDLLSKDELKGVLAHELAHVKNRDTLVTTIAGTIAGIIAYLAAIARWGFIFGDRDNRMLDLLALAIVAPIAGTILQLAISRSREYLADETGAALLHNPHSLASALEKLEQQARHQPLRFGSHAASSLFIVNPFTLQGLLSLFSTHPSTAERVARLRSMQV